MKTSGILFIGLMMSSAAWADRWVASPLTLIHRSGSGQSAAAFSQVAQTPYFQPTLPARVSIFYPTQGQTQIGLCWQGLAIDSEDNVYPVGVGHIFKILPDGKLVNGVNDENLFATGGFSYWAELDESRGSFYAVAGGAIRVAPFVEGSTFSVLLSGLINGEDLAVGQAPLAGSLFATESASRVSRITLAPLGSSVFASGQALFGYPEAIASAPDGSLYVVRLGSPAEQLTRITPTGVPSTFAVGTDLQVRALAVDAAGNVYWSHAHGINKYDPNGNLLGTLPGPPDKPAFQNPMGAEFDSHGNLYIVENNDCKKIYKYTFAIPVILDVKPTINPKSMGVILVVILTTDAFDATTIDPGTVRFGPGGAMEAHGRGHIEDANGDGDRDLVLHFRTQDAGIQCGSTSASLVGFTFGSQSIEGSASIKVVGCK